MSSLISCPYNPVHRIRPERMPYHLVKCKKNFPHADHVVCPFNARHHVPRANEVEHLQNCPDRGIIEGQLHLFAGQLGHGGGDSVEAKVAALVLQDPAPRADPPLPPPTPPMPPQPTPPGASPYPAMRKLAPLPMAAAVGNNKNDNKTGPRVGTGRGRKREERAAALLSRPGGGGGASE